MVISYTARCGAFLLEVREEAICTKLSSSKLVAITPEKESLSTFIVMMIAHPKSSSVHEPRLITSVRSIILGKVLQELIFLHCEDKEKHQKHLAS